MWLKHTLAAIVAGEKDCCVSKEPKKTSQELDPQSNMMGPFGLIYLNVPPFLSICVCGVCFGQDSTFAERVLQNRF
jgi:hypothetical protein